MREIFHTLRGEVTGAARYRWPALIVAWVLCVAGWVAVMLLPNMYESQARVFADTRSALGPVLEGLAIQQDVSAQMNLVQESLLGDAQLSRVIEEVGLGDAGRFTELRARAKLRQNIRISVEASSNRIRPGGSIYWISYRDRDRERSRKVVEILLNSFMQGTVGGKLEDSQFAEKFLGEQIRENEMRLREAETRLAEFKKDNVGLMPGVEGDYFTRLQTELDANRKARTALSVALARRDELTRQLRDGASLAAASGGAGVRPLGLDGRPVAAGDTAGRLLQTRQQLADLLTQYTEKHPAVDALRKEIQDLEERRARELEALRLGDPAAVAASGASADPVYQSIQLALNQVGVEIATLRGEISQHEAKIAEFQQLVKTVPEVEAQFARLNRDYDVTRKQYLALLQRLEEAKLGQDAEESGSGIKLQVLNQPTASIEPVSPKRPMLVAAVFAMAVMGAAALAYVLSKMNPVFNHAREIEEATDRPVLGAVSLTTIDDYKAALRHDYRRYAVAAGGLFLVMVAVLAVSITAPDLVALA